MVEGKDFSGKVVTVLVPGGASPRASPWRASITVFAGTTTSPT